jgi:hypothetical protein
MLLKVKKKHNVFMYTYLIDATGYRGIAGGILCKTFNC